MCDLAKPFVIFMYKILLLPPDIYTKTAIDQGILYQAVQIMLSEEL